jgi:hypothetical protein
LLSEQFLLLLAAIGQFFGITISKSQQAFSRISELESESKQKLHFNFLTKQDSQILRRPSALITIYSSEQTLQLYVFEYLQRSDIL